MYAPASDAPEFWELVLPRSERRSWQTVGRVAQSREADLGRRLARVLGKGWRPAHAGADAVKIDGRRGGAAGARILGVARPGSVDQLAETAALCSKENIALRYLPQHLTAGDVPAQAGGPAIVLSLARMSRIDSIDPIAMTVRVEAGATLRAVQEALAGEGFALAMPEGSDDGLQIGELLTRSAGAASRKMRALVVASDIVLADGRVSAGCGTAPSDRAADALVHLACGADSSLGLVGRVVLRVVPEPVAALSSVLVMADLASALKVAALLRRGAADFLRTLNYFAGDCLATAIPAVGGQGGRRGGAGLVVALSTSAENMDLAGALSTVLSVAIADRAIRESRIGSRAVPVVQRLRALGSSAPDELGLAHKLALPFSRVVPFVAEASAAVQAVLPERRSCPMAASVRIACAST